MNRYLIFLLIPLFLSSCALFRSTTKVAVNQESEKFIAQGKRLMRAGSYPEAMDAFEQGIGEEFYRSATAAIYLSGLAAYYAAYYDVAKRRFSRLKREYPQSRYVEDADYHTALMQLYDRRFNENERGIITLMDLAANAKQSKLRSDALEQVRHSFFSDLSVGQLRTLERRIEKEFQPYWTEALVYKLLKNEQTKEARAAYEAFKSKGGTATDYLKEMLGESSEEKEGKAVFEPNIMRIALALPLFLEEANDIGLDVPRKVKIALEFYEGFEMAIQEARAESGKQIFMEVLDTKRDTGTARALTQRLAKLSPTVLVGAIYNSQSRILSEWAEENGVAMVVPISPAEDLIRDRQYTFLAHPSSEVHGSKMANYAFNTLNLSHVYMFQDRSSSTRSLADGFAQAFVDLGGRVDTMTFSSNYELAIKQIPKLVSEVDDDSAGVYIPVMGNEEASGLIINVLKQKNKKLPVLGSPHFKSRYEAIPRDIKESYGLIFSTSHLTDAENREYMAMEQNYLRTFGYPPSEWVVQGYDLASYLVDELQKFDASQGFTFDTFLRVSSPYKGLHIDYHFNSTQINQAINIGQYQEDGLLKLNP